MRNFYNKSGKKIDTLVWGELMEDSEYKRVGLDKKDGITVSTVWLGLDHSFSDNKLLIFETMVFGLEDEEIMERYSTLEEAQKGHKRFVEKYLN